MTTAIRLASAAVLTLAGLSAGSLARPLAGQVDGESAHAGDARAVHSVTIVATPADVERLDEVRAALEFWNETFSELGLPPAFGKPARYFEHPETRALENYARAVWLQAGRLRDSTGGPPPPELLETLAPGGGVVVLLSAQPLMPFAWRVGPDRHLVAVPLDSDSAVDVSSDDRIGEEANNKSLRNVIAHELGHTLGLTHHSDPRVLMCHPCGLSAAGRSQDADGFSPLTESDRSTLIDRYGIGSHGR